MSKIDWSSRPTPTSDYPEICEWMDKAEIRIYELEAKIADLESVRAEDETWISVNDCPLDHERRLFITGKGMQRVDWFQPNKQTPSKGGIHWQELPADRYTHYQELPSPPNKQEID